MDLDLETILKRLLQLVDKEFETNLLNTMISAAIADDDFQKRIKIKNQLSLISDKGTIVNITDKVTVLLEIQHTTKKGINYSMLIRVVPNV